MSHRSKIDLLRRSKLEGYKNYLYFVSTESAQINVDRVGQRVQRGGHPVNEDKIRSRHLSSLENLKQAINQTYRSFIFDNSGKEPILILEVFKGEEVTINMMRFHTGLTSICFLIKRRN